MNAVRQITQQEKDAVLAQQGLRCFIDNHPLLPDEVEFDHIRPYAANGESEIANIGVVCKKHNRDKGTLSLAQYRDRLDMRRFFGKAAKRRLDDLLEERLGHGQYGQRLPADAKAGLMELFFDGGGQTAPLYTCPSTGEQYFFASIPFSVIRNDAELQPRPLEPERVWDLYLHLQDHTQLAPAVCRLTKGDLLLFDGQHKAAAQVWAGRKALDCKVYVEPDVRRLKETNLSAHDKLRQMPFYTSTLLEKYAALAKEDWEAFLLIAGPKNERTFCDFMRLHSNLSRAEAVKRVRSRIYQDVLEDPNNRLREYIAEENRARQNPLAMHRLQKTFFAEFLVPPPLDDEFEGDTYHRDDEKTNLVRLFNLIVDEGLANRWSPETNDAAHKKAARLFSAGALRAWVPMLRDAIAAALALIDAQDRAKVFYRELDDAKFGTVALLVKRLFSHKVWEDPDPGLNDLRYDDAQRAKGMLMEHGLSANWVLGAKS